MSMAELDQTVNVKSKRPSGELSKPSFSNFQELNCQLNQFEDSNFKQQR